MRALVFSAGGAFGAYQVGAWQALEEFGFRPRLVVGASIGSVHAAAMARGASAQRLREWWRDPASNVFQDNWSQRLLGRLEELLEEFPHSGQAAGLKVTAMELPSTRTRVFADQEVTARVLLASCSIPLLFPAVRLDSRLYLDGGVFCRLPVGLAAEAGASEIAAVDLLAAAPSALLRFGLDAARLLRGVWVRERRLLETGSARVLVIASEQRLGSPADMVRWDPGQIDRWIEQGYRDACRILSASPPQSASPKADSAPPR